MDRAALIAKLEEVLDRARAGEIGGIALTLVEQNSDGFDVFFVGDDMLKLLGATAFLEKRVGDAAYMAVLPQT